MDTFPQAPYNTTKYIIQCASFTEPYFEAYHHENDSVDGLDSNEHTMLGSMRGLNVWERLRAEYHTSRNAVTSQMEIENASSEEEVARPNDRQSVERFMHRDFVGLTKAPYESPEKKDYIANEFLFQRNLNH